MKIKTVKAVLPSAVMLEHHEGNRGVAIPTPKPITKPDAVTRLPHQKKRMPDGTLTQTLSGSGLKSPQSTAQWATQKAPADPNLPKTIRTKIVGAANPKSQGKTVGNWTGAIENE